MRTLLTFLFFSFLTVFILALSDAKASDINTRNLSFNIWRDGSNIGTQTLTFSNSGNQTIADIRINIEVRILGIVAYRYTKSGTEVWTGGEFTSITIQTNDDGDRYNLSVVNDGSEILVTSNNNNSTLAANFVPSTYWHKEAFITGRIFSSQSGERLNLSIRPEGIKTVKLGNKTVTAEAYKVSGDINGTYYYSGNTWVGLEFIDSSGEVISYEPLFNF